MSRMKQHIRRTSVSIREGPKEESSGSKEIKQATDEVFNCCTTESPCRHRKSLCDNTLKSESWTGLASSEAMQFAREGIAKVEDRKHSVSEDGDTFIFGNERDFEGKDEEDALDDFQKAVRCLKSAYKTFAATNFDRLVREDQARAMNEVWPKLEKELRKSSGESEKDSNSNLNGICSTVENFHEPAASKFPFAVVELYKNGNNEGARKILELVFALISVEIKEISGIWVACLEKLIESCESSNVQKDIYPSIVELTGSRKHKRGSHPPQPPPTSNAKIGACRLLRKLAKRFNHEVIQRKVFPMMDTLAKDPDYLVRMEAASSLPEMIHRLQKKDEALKIINLIKEDSDHGVKAALISTIMKSVTLMSARDSKNREYLESVMQTIKSLVKEAYVRNNVELLVAYSEYMGYICQAFTVAGIMKGRDILWYLDAFIQLSRFNAKTFETGRSDKEEELPLGFANYRANMEFNRRHSIVEALVSTKTTVQTDRDNSQAQLSMTKAITVLRKNAENKRLSIPYGGILPPSAVIQAKVFGPDMEKAHECRVNAAKQFYDFMVFAKPIVGFRHGLHPLLTELMHDFRPEVRAAVAEKIVDIMEYLGPEAGVLHGELVYALSDDDVSVIESLVPNMTRILKCLVLAKVLSPEKVTPKLVEIGGAILYCEERLNQTTFYKVHQSMLEQWNILPFCLPGDYVYNNFVPALFHRLRHMRVLPCRMAAAHAIVIFLRHCRRSAQREEMRMKIRTGFAEGRSVHDRMLFLYMAKKMMEHFSRKYFRDHFIEDVLLLANDPIGNVRRKVIELLPELKEAAEDPELHKRLEDTFHSARKSEIDKDVIDKLQQISAGFKKRDSRGSSSKKGKRRKSRDGNGPKPKKMDANDIYKEMEEEFIENYEKRMASDGTDSFNGRRLSFYGSTKRKSIDLNQPRHKSFTSLKGNSSSKVAFNSETKVVFGMREK